ncbi:MAG: hypothetical protein ACPG19_09805 [Saprospiraceae bacterium]
MKINKTKIFQTLTLLLLVLVFSQCTPAAKVSSNTNEDPVFFADEGCPDLILEELKVVKKKKSEVTISYKITNKGDAPFSLLGKDKKKKKDNIAIKMYFSSNETLENGDILLGGIYIDNDANKEQEGKLAPGKSYEGTLKVSVKNQTSFTPFLILDVDAWQFIIECDETNNQAAITL